MENLIDFGALWESAWFRISLVLLVLVPTLTIALNELSYRYGLRGREVGAPIQLLKNFVLPIIILTLAFRYLFSDYVSPDGTFIKIMETISWILVINVAIAIINRLFFEQAANTSWRGNVPQLFLDIFRVVIVAIGAAIVLSAIWDINIGSAITALGLGSFVIGLALQDTLGNLFSGIALVYERPFTVGDFIRINDHTGKVIEMNWRSIRMLTREQEMIVVPHLVAGQGTIVNLSRPVSTHRLQIHIGFAYEDAPNKVKSALRECTFATPGVLHDPPPEIKVIEYGDSSINYEIEFAIRDYGVREEVTDDLMTRLWYVAKRHDLNIPFPQMAIRPHSESLSAEEERHAEANAAVADLPSLLPVENEHLHELADQSEMQYFGAGETIISRGERTEALFIIMRGEVAMSFLNAQGQETEMTLLHRGEFFGEISMAGGRSSQLTVTAREDTQLLVLHPQQVIGMVDRNPYLAQELDAVLDARRSALQDQR